MPLLFSPVPLVNKLLTIAADLAKENGHYISSYSKERMGKEDMYFATCVVCKADVRLVFSVHNYDRAGSAFEKKCKPG